MPIEITTLIENTQGEHTGLITEHGLSFLIETGKSSTLFDTGRSNAFLKNAKLLGKRLDGVEHVVLSHGHYDHSGGFQSFVQSRADRAFTLHTGQGFFAEKYARFNASYQYLGNDFDQEYIKEQGITHHTITGKTEIVPGVWALTHFKRNHAEETIHPRFVLRGQAGWVEDRFDDEVLLVVETGKGLVMLVGCSHPGILNMLDSVQQAFNKPVYALLGGTHLVEADRPRVARSIQAFQEKGIEVLGINHCSGAEAIKLATEHSSIHFHNSTGSCLIL
ncbi:MAG: MBL fold metallo-hydrolase [Sphaerochaeta sp.]|jgi:7,8-dihydropterin-6-yl-methyl-4-(beta-D-ribofuranosyl)aminobenzene 5'-phosphate synthase|uniref:MBL fold metallo-hydrolase n=1 Tax=Sphaerochaeta sp. TaxID=1972642 RepID=UPI003D0ABF35